MKRRPYAFGDSQDESDDDPDQANLRKYKKVSDDLRQQLVQMVDNGAQIKNAAQQLNINYENAKVICRTYRLEGRAIKKSSYKQMLAESECLSQLGSNM